MPYQRAYSLGGMKSLATDRSSGSGGTTGSSTMGNYNKYLSEMNQSANAYGVNQQPNQTGYVPQNITDQMDYIKGLTTGYTPEQELAMRNRIRATDTAQNTGAMSRIKDLFASQGLGGSGAEAAALGNMIRSQNATRQGALSNLDISNAQTDLANQYARAGMLNSLAGIGEQGRQFGVNQANDLYKTDAARNADMYRWGKEFDWNKYKDKQTYSDYQDQLETMLKYLNIR